ncbi:MAG: PKD domain-containing protein [Thermoplasmata archaeon]|nr:PKD domain-containing protein [Thermoplasmata archaeon]
MSKFFTMMTKVYLKSVTVRNNRVNTKIPWEEFAIGNDKYTIKVSYGDKNSEEDFYLTDFNWAVCEKVMLSAQLNPAQFSEIDPTQPKLKITLGFVDEDENNLHASVKDLAVTISIQYEDNIPIEQKKTLTGNELFNNDYLYEYDYATGGGNYTISATVQNQFVQSDSKYATVTSDTFDEMINLLPLAVVDTVGDYTISGNTITVRNNEDVTFNASTSRNDGDIVSYEWDFDFDGTTFEFTVDDTGAEVTHTFTGRGQLFYIAMRVTGDVYVEDPLNPGGGEHIEYTINSYWEVQVQLL